MIKDHALAVGLIVVGVLVNNYIYLHDVVLAKHVGTIFLGRASMIAVVASLIPIAAGLILITRSPEKRRRDED